MVFSYNKFKNKIFKILILIIDLTSVIFNLINLINLNLGVFLFNIHIFKTIFWIN